MVPDAAAWFALVAGGLVAGFVSTLFGVGGGLVMVPILHYGLGLPFPTATALSLLAMTVQSPAGVFQHARRNAVSWRLGLLLAIGGLAGVGIGIALAPHVSVPMLKLLFAVVMAFAAFRMLWRIRPRAAPQHHPALIAGAGALAGAASKLLGIGGGLVTVPILALLGTPMHLAVGSSLVSVFTNAAVASAANLATGLDWWPAVGLAAGALAGAPFGTRAAHALHADELKRAFAATLAVAAVYVAGTSGAW